MINLLKEFFKANTNCNVATHSVNPTDFDDDVPTLLILIENAGNVVGQMSPGRLLYEGTFKVVIGTSVYRSVDDTFTEVSNALCKIGTLNNIDPIKLIVASPIISEGVDSTNRIIMSSNLSITYEVLYD